MNPDDQRFVLMAAAAETEVLPMLEELGIGFVPYSQLGKGFSHRTQSARRIVASTPSPPFCSYGINSFFAHFFCE